MSSTDVAIDRPQRLPIQVPLRPAESPDSFIRRLAVANYLRPSYLRTYLNDPPGRIGSIQAWRLAAVTGRTEEELIRVMPGLEAVTRSRPAPRHQTQQPDLHTAIRRAAERDEEVKRLSKQFGLRRPTTIKALTGQTSTATWFQQRQPHRSPILQGVAGYLDQIIADNPQATIWSIWKKLGQERQAEVCYGTVRNYVNRVRAQPTDTTSVKFLVSRADLFARIRGEAADRDLVTRLAAQFSVDHATVMRALTGQDPPPAKRYASRRNPILEDLRHHIDEMISTNPDVTVATIWERLVDHHHAEVSYATVRDYIARERRPRARSDTATATA